MQEHILTGALKVIYSPEPDQDSLDSKADKGSSDTEMDNIARMYTGFGGPGPSPCHKASPKDRNKLADRMVWFLLIQRYFNL